MSRALRLLLPLALLAALAACNTDPFGMKPEVSGVKIPEQRTVPDAEIPDSVVPDADIPEVQP